MLRECLDRSLHVHRTDFVFHLCVVMTKTNPGTGFRTTFPDNPAARKHVAHFNVCGSRMSDNKCPPSVQNLEGFATTVNCEFRLLRHDDLDRFGSLLL